MPYQTAPSPSSDLPRPGFVLLYALAPKPDTASPRDDISSPTIPQGPLAMRVKTDQIGCGSLHIRRRCVVTRRSSRAWAPTSSTTRFDVAGPAAC